jgi:hypothetical protein
MVARMPRYVPAPSGIRSESRIPAIGQNGSSRHVQELFGSSSRSVNEYRSGLLIRTSIAAGQRCRSRTSDSGRRGGTSKMKLCNHERRCPRPGPRRVHGGSMTGIRKSIRGLHRRVRRGHCIALLGCVSLTHRDYVAWPSVTPSLRTRAGRAVWPDLIRSRKRAWLGRCRHRSCFYRPRIPHGLSRPLGPAAPP